MFTGLIEEVGTVRGRTALGEAAQLHIAAPRLRQGLAHGDSVAVAGVCLTVAQLDPEGFVADVVPESLARTTLGTLGSGSRVNLERALAADGRFGGHLVQGHVDGVGAVQRYERGERWVEMEVTAPGDTLRYVAEKGSVAVEGVSLTVTGVDADSFGIALIPTTLAATTLGALDVGSAVNLEVDVLAKYVARLLVTEAAP